MDARIRAGISLASLGLGIAWFDLSYGAYWNNADTGGAFADCNSG
jgi:hypothetical protein